MVIGKAIRPTTDSSTQLTAKETATGAVNFIIGGAHQVIVYSPGKKPTDVVLGTLVPLGPGLIDDPVKRMYRGLSPFGNPFLPTPVPPPPQDRVEVVHFPNPGLHLVICGLLPHFQDDDMFGWVWVLR